MTKAYQCDRCGEYEQGSGRQARIGERVDGDAIFSSHNFAFGVELCDECYDGLIQATEAYLAREDTDD